jgi:hypothetical protein
MKCCGQRNQEWSQHQGGGTDEEDSGREQDDE